MSFALPTCTAVHTEADPSCCFAECPLVAAVRIVARLRLRCGRWAYLFDCIHEKEAKQ